MKAVVPRRQTAGRTRRTPRRSIPLIAIIWAAASAATVAVASETAVGPVILTLSENHGIHLGDAIFASAAALSASAATWLARWR